MNRKAELVALLVAPIAAVAFFAFILLLNDWNALAGGLICNCLAVPVYLAWLVWFLVRGQGRRV